MTGLISPMSRGSALIPLPPSTPCDAGIIGHPHGGEGDLNSWGNGGSSAAPIPPRVLCAPERRAPESGGKCASNADLTPPRVLSASLRGRWKNGGRLAAKLPTFPRFSLPHPPGSVLTVEVSPGPGGGG